MGRFLSSKLFLVEREILRPAVFLAEADEGAGTASSGIGGFSTGTDRVNRGNDPGDVALFDDKSGVFVEGFRRTARFVRANGSAACKRLNVYRRKIVFVSRV